MSLPWIEKYRPANLDEISGHEVKIQTLKQLIARNELPHLLFYGSPGTGKTSTILACAIELYGLDNYKKYVQELNASDDRGIDVVRNKIKDFVRTASNKVKLVILDEADAMTHDAQNALRRVIEKNSKTSRFCLICNDITKIIAGLQSRCAKMNFGTLSPEQIRPNIDYIIEEENISISSDAVDRLININRDFRQIINTIQFMKSMTIGQIEVSDIDSYLGIPSDADINNTIDSLMSRKNTFAEMCDYMYNLFKDNKWAVSDFISKITNIILHNKKMPDLNKAQLMIRLSDIDFKVNNCNDYEIQMYALVGAFYMASGN